MFTPFKLKKPEEMLTMAVIYSNAAKANNTNRKVNRLKCPPLPFITEKELDEIYAGGKKRGLYDLKKILIIKLLKGIAQHKWPGYYYYIHQENEGTVIVYFNFMIGDERLQLSFHIWKKDVIQYMKKTKDFCTNWEYRKHPDYVLSQMWKSN